MAAAAAPAVPFATDLRSYATESARSAAPLVLFFTLPDCAYCHTVRHSYLAPLVRGEGGRRYVVREIVIDSQRKVAGLDGKAATHRALAQRFGVRFGPTVLFVDGVGKALAPPLVGGDTAGMYGAYLDARLAEASGRLANAVK
ncbi:thioredoxin family protein [Massilia cavernae]|uniref:thioredoxin family protein n=1 Tax=Massilia cavernae TaxID=2320864 RepID=UPI0016046BB3|nr:thioredoxin fold domain-containing protein [Massilia cavernae]